MASDDQKKTLISGLMNDVVGEDISEHRYAIADTIESILKDYNLSTDLSFVEKIANIKFDGKTGESVDITSMPKELQDAAFLPVNTISDIALRQDLDLIISQIPEWFVAVQIIRDAICEADLADGKLTRSITFDRTNLSDSEQSSIMSKIEKVEERLELHSMIRNHVVFDSVHYGESYVYNIPYAKVFEDLYKYRLNNAEKNGKNRNSTMNMFSTSSVLTGYGYGESAVEISLNDTVISETTNHSKSRKGSKQNLFTEAEIIDIYPDYHSKTTGEGSTSNKHQKCFDEEFDNMIDTIGRNIRFINQDIALPVIEESAYDLKCVYETKYQSETQFISEFETFFEEVMEKNDDLQIDRHFKNIKGVYTRILPATKLIPVRIDRNVIGYYYISDMTRPEEQGQCRNSGLSGYTLKTPSVGFDTFQPDQMFCQKLASKIIQNFDLKFMRDNTALHQQIVSILQSHKFNEAMMRFIFIPAEHVSRFSINEDGMGKGHSVLEPGLVAGRMYMFLKLYSVLYQINNSQIRIYNVRQSGIDKNYKQLIQDTMRKFAERRITANDIFNYRSSMNKVSGCSEMVMPLGAGNTPPIEISSTPAAEAPINNDLLEAMKHEAINATPVPSLMVMGGMSEIEFAKETELANARLTTTVNSLKIDLNTDITKFYRVLLRWETDIDPVILRDLKFSFKKPAAKELNLTVEMINNFNAVAEMAVQVFLPTVESKNAEQGSEVIREFKKLLVAELLPQIDVDRYDQLAKEAIDAANRTKLDELNNHENLVDDLNNSEEEVM